MLPVFFRKGVVLKDRRDSVWHYGQNVFCKNLKKNKILKFC